MSKLSLIERNKRNILNVKKHEVKRKELMSISNNQSLSMIERLNAFFKIQKMGKYASKICIVPRCCFTGRAKGKFVKAFGAPISRIKLRELASEGYLPGIKKYSW